MSEPSGGAADDLEWVARYRDLGVDQALRLARLERRPVRVVGPGQMMTADWVPSRLTIQVDGAGEVVSVRAG
jgi:hypothetical protein